MLTGPKGDLVMCGKTLATLRRNVLNDIFDIVGKNNYKWTDKQQGELTLLGRNVYCVGANNEESESKIRGATFAGALCDEVNLYPEIFFNQLMARMSVEGAQCFCTCNPDSPFHWFYTGYIMNDAIENKQRWSFILEDNLNLSSEYVRSLKQMYTGLFYQRFILGKWCMAEGAIFDMFDPAIHVVNREFEPWKIIIGCDYGTSSVMTWSKIAVGFDDSYHKIAEYYYDAKKKQKQLSDKLFADQFEQFISDVDYNDLYAIYCDPSASSWKAELRDRGLVVQDGDNDVINGIRCVSSLLSQKKYTVDPSCSSTISEYPSYSWDGEAQKRGIDKPIKQFDHTCDADRYAIYTHFQYGTSGVYRKR